MSSRGLDVRAKKINLAAKAVYRLIEDRRGTSIVALPGVKRSAQICHNHPIF